MILNLTKKKNKKEMIIIKLKFENNDGANAFFSPPKVGAKAYTQSWTWF
jgi:hypothetical protein